MKIGAVPDNAMEREALAAGAVPVPLIESMGLIKMRIVMAAVRLGLFEAIGPGSLTAEAVAARCGTHPAATGKILDALTGAGYLVKTEGARTASVRYQLAPVTRQWLVQDSPRPLVDFIQMQYLLWDWLAHCEEYVSSGTPYIIHPHMTEEQWGIYQRSMRALAGLRAANVAEFTPVPEGARAMIDIGGAHGYNSVVLCRRYPNLSAVVLDLPQAVKQSAPILAKDLAKEGLDGRVTHRAGSALTEDLGVEQWDVVYMANLIQNFDEPSNQELFRRAARALKPGGVMVVEETFRPASPEHSDQVTLLLDFNFAMTSTSKTWSETEIAGWQAAAGLAPRETIYFPPSRDYGQQAAVKL